MKIYEKCERGAGYLTTKGGVSMHLLSLSSGAERNPFRERASSATLDAQSTATELGGDRDKRRNVLMGVSLTPQWKAREENLCRRRTANRKKKCCFTYT